MRDDDFSFKWIVPGIMTWVCLGLLGLVIATIWHPPYPFLRWVALGFLPVAIGVVWIWAREIGN